MFPYFVSALFSLVFTPVLLPFVYAVSRGGLVKKEKQEGGVRKKTYTIKKE